MAVASLETATSFAGTQEQSRSVSLAPRARGGGSSLVLAQHVTLQRSEEQRGAEVPGQRSEARRGPGKPRSVRRPRSAPGARPALAAPLGAGGERQPKYCHARQEGSPSTGVRLAAAVPCDKCR